MSKTSSGSVIAWVVGGLTLHGLYRLAMLCWPELDRPVDWAKVLAAVERFGVMMDPVVQVLFPLAAIAGLITAGITQFNHGVEKGLSSKDE